MTALYENRDMASMVSEKLKTYAQPQRLMILSCLLRGERSVAEIGEATGIGQPALSQQLAELRRADLVRTRKQVKQVWYQLADDSVHTCVRTMESIFCSAEPAQLHERSTQHLLTEPLPEGVAAFARISPNRTHQRNKG